MRLTQPMKDFILHWGEMGTRWGVNCSVAQVHALLHLSQRPLPADKIAETLGLARSNVSTALKELQAWKLVRVSRELGDRREREYAPTLAAVREVLAEAKADGETPAEVVGRLRETLEVMQQFDCWYAEMARLPRGTQLALLRMGARLARLLPKETA